MGKQRRNGPLVLVELIALNLLFLTCPCNSVYALDITKPNIAGHFGTAVNSYTGNLFYQRTDFLLPGRGLSIKVEFSYNSGRTQNDLGYGNGWSFSYGMQYFM